MEIFQICSLKMQLKAFFRGVWAYWKIISKNWKGPWKYRLVQALCAPIGAPEVLNKDTREP